MTTAKISPLYLEIGKQLAQQLALAYAAINPGAALAMTAVNAIMTAQAAIVQHNKIITQAQAEAWTEEDPRWDAPLAEQQARMDAENARHAAMTRDA